MSMRRKRTLYEGEPCEKCGSMDITPMTRMSLSGHFFWIGVMLFVVGLIIQPVMFLAFIFAIMMFVPLFTPRMQRCNRCGKFAFEDTSKIER